MPPEGTRLVRSSVVVALPTTLPALGEVKVTDTWPLLLVVRLKVSTLPTTLLGAGVVEVMLAPLVAVSVMVTAVVAPPAGEPPKAAPPPLFAPPPPADKTLAA